jgi:two-component system, cell cycle sensor histidine kinase and response regulator CckA
VTLADQLLNACIPEDTRAAIRQALTDAALFDAFLAAVPATVYFKDRESRFVRVSRAQADLLGVADPSDALGRTDADFFSPEHAADALADERRVMASGEAIVGKLEHIRHANGQLRWVTTTKMPLRSAEGEVVGTFGITTDISDQRAAEEALQRSEERVRRIIESSPLGMHLYELLPDDRLIFRGANPAANRMVGVDCAQFVGMTIEEAFPPLVETPIPAMYRRAARTGEPWQTEHVAYEDGRIHGAYEVYVFQTQPGFAAAMFLETTERRRTEEELRLAQYVLDHMSEGAFWVRSDGRMAYVNEEAARLLGYSREELLSMSVPDIDITLSPEAWTLHWEEVRERGSFSVQTVLRTRDGREFPVEIATNYVEFGGLEFNCALARDLTERNRVEEERRQLEAQVQHAQKLESLGLLAGGIAHDFNNILMGVLGNASLALTILPPESPAYPCVTQLETAALRAAELAKQMLAYSGKGRFVVERLDLARLVGEMTHLLEVSISKKALLIRHLEPGSAVVRGDATQLRQVVMNLITNASDALGETQGVITIRTGVVDVDAAYLASTYIDDELAEGRYAVLEVSDTGCGMDAATQVRMFDPFFSTKRTGRGLGMAAVLGIVRGHGGALKVYSEPGHGTAMRVLLPASDDAAVPETAVDSQGLAEPAADALQTGLVLVADDEPLVRQVARLGLEMAGYSVVEAGDGEEAVALFSEHADGIVAVVLDMSMPRLGGAEAFARIRHIRPDATVVLSSGFNEQDSTQDLVGRGIAGFIQKPYRPSELVAKLRSVTTGSPQR